MKTILTIEKAQAGGYALRSENFLTLHPTLDEAITALRAVFEVSERKPQ